MKSAISPYSKMFLVTPSVYQKMLNCISEKEQMVTNALNIPETEVEQSPTEKIVGEIAQSDFGSPKKCGKSLSARIYWITQKSIAKLTPYF